MIQKLINWLSVRFEKLADRVHFMGESLTARLYHESTISAKVIRANGKVEDRGVISRSKVLKSRMKGNR